MQTSSPQLDPQVQTYLDKMAYLGGAYIYALSDQAAKEAGKVTALLGGIPERLSRIEDRTVPGPYGPIPVRIYVPEGEGPFGILQYMHGGGWQIQSIQTHDGPCRTLAHEAGCIVVSVDYRLTPQFVYPVQIDECYTVLEWIAANAHRFKGDRRRIAVGGDSAGGNLAAVMALKARDQHGVALKFQLLVYPTVDYYDPGKPSYDQFKEGYGMAALDMKHFFDLYLPHGFERDDPYIFPLRAKDLRNLPPALIINANFDVLRDEGKLYADRLKEAQVPVKRSVYEGMIHTFFNLRGLLDQSSVALAEAACALQHAFAVQ